jgi:hypothetical protein
MRLPKMRLEWRPPQESKRIFGIIPNNRTSPGLKDYKPLSPKAKFEIASQDSFDRGAGVLAAAFAAEAQLTRADPSFGQGLQGDGRYFGTSYGDFVIGNYMSVAIFPVLLHQDPRYFRRGVGSGWSRLAYSARSNLLDPHGFRADSVQLLGDRRQFDGSGDFKRILSGQPECERFGNQARYPDRRRYGVQRSEGILARCKPEVQASSIRVLLAKCGHMTK